MIDQIAIQEEQELGILQCQVVSLGQQQSMILISTEEQVLQYNATDLRPISQQLACKIANCSQ